MTDLKSAFENKMEQIKQDLSAHVTKEVEKACSSYASEELPYLENDTVQNVEHRAKEILRLFLEDREPKTSLEFRIFDLLDKEFKGEEIRRKIFEENKQELSKLISNDLIKENQNLRENLYDLERLLEMKTKKES